MNDQAMVQQFDMLELQALHQEVATRITIQNACVLLSAPMLIAAGAAMQASPTMAMAAAVMLAASVGICSLVWCHNGVRQAQIKTYLLILAERYSADGGWENWLPGDRMPGLLGNRWFVATKGAMLGAQFFGIMLAIYIGGQPLLLPLISAFAILAGTAWLLLTNPKEGLSPAPAAGRMPSDAT